MPGAFGNFEAAVKLMMIQFGYSSTLSLNFATCVHLASYIVMTVLGLGFFFRLGHTFSGLTRMLDKKE